MKLGVSLPEAVRDDDAAIIDALDRFAASAAMPRLFALWRSLSPEDPRYGFPSSSLLDALATRRVWPVIFLESSPTRQMYEHVEFHARLAACAEFAAAARDYGSRIYVRLDHEMNGSVMPWAGKPERYKLAWRAQSDVLHDAPNLRLIWCPQGSKPDTFAAYWPGDDYVDMVGFDKYDLGTRRPLPKAWEPPIASIRALTASPILVCEWASIVGPDDAARVVQLRTQADVRDIWGAMYFHIDMGQMSHPSDTRDWRMSPNMLQEWARQAAL